MKKLFRFSFDEILGGVPQIPKGLELKYQVYHKEFFEQVIRRVIYIVGVPVFVLFWIGDFFLIPDNVFLAFVFRFSFLPFCIFVFWLFKKGLFGKHYAISYFVIIQYVVVALNILAYQNSNLETKLVNFYGYHLVATTAFALVPLSSILVLLTFATLYIPIFVMIVGRVPVWHVVFQVLVTFSFMVTILFNNMVRARYMKLEFLSKEQMYVEAKLGEAIAQISHDVRSPLFALRTVASSLNIADAHLKLLKMALARLVEQMDGLINFATQLKIVKKPVRTELLVENIKNDINFIYPDVEVSVEGDGQGVIYCDLPKILRVVGNLVSNGVRATRLNRTNKVLVHIIVDSEFEVHVLDSGPGFDGAIEGKMTRGKSGFGSTGFGLYFCRNVISEHGENLFVTKQNGMTSVSFRLDIGSVGT